MPDQTRKLAAIMFTDIAGYTESMSYDEQTAIQAVKKKRSIIQPLIKDHNGVFVKEIGDGTLSYFSSAVDASNCAINLQEMTYDEEHLNIRVGLHIGDIVFDGEDVFGEGVNIASRLESLSPIGGVCVSKNVFDELENKKEFNGESLGLQTLKGVGRLVEVYALKGDKLKAPDKSQYKATKVDKHTDDEVPSIAIIPFENKGAEEDVFYAYGISADLITDCSSAGLIRVASIKRVEEVAELSLDEKAKKLDVRYTAEGTLWKMGDMFQLSIELYDTKEQKVVWSDRWQENWDNLSSIKSTLSDGLLKALDTKPKVEQRIETANPEAYEYYLRAKHTYSNRDTKDDIAISRDLLNKALQLDSNFVESKILLAATYQDYEISLKHYFEALKITERLNDKKSELTIKANLGVIYSELYDDENALKYLTESHELAREVGNETSLAKSLNALGSYHFQRRTEETRYYFGEVLKIAKKLEDNMRICGALNGIGLIYWIWDGDIEKAIDAFEESIQFAEKMDNYNMATTPASNIAIIYNNQRKYELSQKHYQKLLNHAQETGNLQDEGFLKLFKSQYNLDILDYDSALEYLKSSYEINHEVGRNRWRNIALSLVLFCYIALNDDENIKKYQKEIDDLGDGFHTTEAYDWLAWRLFRIGKYSQAIKYIEKQIDIETTNKNDDVLIDLRSSKGVFLFYNENYEKALEIFDKLIANTEKDGKDASYNFLTYKCLAMKNLGQPYDIEKLKALIEKEESGNPTWKEKMWHMTALELFNLLGDREYINVAYKEIDNLFNFMTPENREIASTFPIYKAILEAYNRVLN